jgi:hypothetical protein
VCVTLPHLEGELNQWSYDLTEHEGLLFFHLQLVGVDNGIYDLFQAGFLAGELKVAILRTHQGCQ